MPKIDFSGVETNSYVPVPNGTYRLQFQSAEFVAKSKSSGQPMYKAKFVVDDESLGELNGATIWHNWSLSPAALWRFKQEAVVLGAEPEDLEGEVDTDDVIREITGNYVLADVVVDEYEPGKSSNKIARMQEDSI